MKIRVLIILIFALLFMYLFPADLIDIYQKGEIKFIPDHGFGENVNLKCDDIYKGMAIAPDGSIFVVNQSQHNISKFDNSGRFIRSFSKKGHQPGDLFYPGSVSIMNKRFLLVGGMPRNCRFKLFDLDGNLENIVSTKNPAYSIVSLKNRKVAYLSWEKHYCIDGKGIEKKITVFIKDLLNEEEIEVTSCVVRDPGTIDVGGRTRIATGTYFTGDVFIERAKGGNLLVGLSIKPELTIFSPEGKKIKTFPLMLKAVKVSETSLERELQHAKTNSFKKRKDLREFESEFIEKLLSKQLFNKYLPYFRKILVDAEGNILVFKEKTSYFDETIHFQVYSAEGDFICDTTIDPGNYKLDIDSLRWFRKLHFTEKGIFALLELKNSNRPRVRILKIKYND